MKKILLFIQLFILAIITFGQQGKVNLGIEGSPTYTFLRGNEMLEEYNEPTFAYAVGLLLQYNNSEHISIVTNITYERKGCVAMTSKTDPVGNVIGNIFINNNFDYISVPVLFRFTIGKKVKYFINAGPFLSYLVSHSEVIEGTNMPSKFNSYIDLFKRYDLGISAGLGFILTSSDKRAYFIEIRNNLGLVNISDTPVYNNGTIKTNSTNFLIGVAFFL